MLPVYLEREVIQKLYAKLYATWQSNLASKRT